MLGRIRSLLLCLYGGVGLDLLPDGTEVLFLGRLFVRARLMSLARLTVWLFVRGGPDNLDCGLFSFSLLENIISK